MFTVAGCTLKVIHQIIIYRSIKLFLLDTSVISTSASYHANVRYSDPCPDCCDNNNQNWGNPSYLFASARTDFAHDCGIGVTRFFLYFAEINEIPANVTVQAAIIKLFGVREGESWMGFRDDSPNDMEMKRVTSPWYAHRTSWNNQPNSTDINSVIIPGTTLRGEYNPVIDVTALVRDMRSAGQKNYGFVFKMQVEVPYRSCAFYSLQYKDVTRRPKLELQLVSENL